MLNCVRFASGSYRARKLFFSGNDKLAGRPRWSGLPRGRHSGPDGVFQNKKQSEIPATQVTKTNSKERAPCQVILDHFDLQYSRELGDLWPSVRAVLVDPRSWTYGVLLNRFTAVSDFKQALRSQGFSALQPHRGPAAVDPETHTGEDRRSSAQPVSNPPANLPCSPPQCYIHPYPLRFPSQAHRPGQLKQYYLLNAASLLPVLALQVRDGEKVLDLCSAPGGKALVLMQCADPGFLCCNEPDAHRRDRLAKTLESFLPRSLAGRVMVSAQDGRAVGQTEPETYDKVLVDAPCSNDRSWLYSPTEQQGQRRLAERARLPQLQAQLLRSALAAVRPGGAVVYSTCTLSASENHGVVESVLRDCPGAEAEDLWEEVAAPFSGYFAFEVKRPARRALRRPQRGAVAPQNQRLGLLVVPQSRRPWGPMFLSRIRKRK